MSERCGWVGYSVDLDQTAPVSALFAQTYLSQYLEYLDMVNIYLSLNSYLTYVISARMGRESCEFQV